jgi:hypothetical protein
MRLVGRGHLLRAMNKTRREFARDVGRLVLLLPAGWMLFQAGCEGDECATADDVSSTATAIVVTSTCDDGHTHDYSIAMADLATPPAAGVSGNTTAYEDDGHVHAIALAQADLMQIQSGTTVTKMSASAVGHVHTFNFRKA